MEPQDCSQTGEGVALAQHTALELFQIGAMLLGNENGGRGSGRSVLRRGSRPR
jgi:hypothetical protein